MESALLLECSNGQTSERCALRLLPTQHGISILHTLHTLHIAAGGRHVMAGRSILSFSYVTGVIPDRWSRTKIPLFFFLFSLLFIVYTRWGFML